MISRRALISSLKQQQQPHSALKTNPNFSRFSTSPSPNPNPKPSLFHSSPLLRNQRLLGSFSSQWVSVSVNDAINTNVGGGVRFMSTRMMNDSSNRPPKETIMLDGCDFEHWFVVMKNIDLNLTRDEIIDIYIKTLAQVIGSEEEARMKIYCVSTRHYFAFGCLVPEELSYKMKDLPNVQWVLPDSYLDVRNKDYGGEPFIDGQAVPYDPKYHEDYLRNKHNAENKARSPRRRRPRPGNFESGRENMNMMERNIPPTPTPNSTSQTPHGSNRNFTPNLNYQNQTPSSPMPNRHYSNRNMQPPAPGRNMSLPQMQNQNCQSSYSQQPIQSPGFQSTNVPSYGNSQGMNMSPQPQNWNSGRRDMLPPMQNQDFQHRNTARSLQNHAYQSRDMPPMQNYNFNNKDMPPMQNHDFQNQNMGDVQQGAHQNQDFNMNMGNGQGHNLPGISPNFQSQNVANEGYEATAKGNY